MLVADVTTDGRGARLCPVRCGEARARRWPSGDGPDGSVPRLLGAGYLAFTVDQGEHTDRYQGIVELQGATLADCAHHYFRQSEQLPAGIKVAVTREEQDGVGHWRAAALTVQQMPEFDAGRIDIDAEQREDDWRKAVILMASANRRRDARSEARERAAPVAAVPCRAAARLRAADLRRALPLRA